MTFIKFEVSGSKVKVTVKLRLHIYITRFLPGSLIFKIGAHIDQCWSITPIIFWSQSVKGQGRSDISMKIGLRLIN